MAARRPTGQWADLPPLRYDEVAADWSSPVFPLRKPDLYATRIGAYRVPHVQFLHVVLRCWNPAIEEQHQHQHQHHRFPPDWRLLIVALLRRQPLNSAMRHIRLERRHPEPRQAVREVDGLRGHTSHEQHGVHNTKHAKVPTHPLFCVGDEPNLSPPDSVPRLPRRRERKPTAAYYCDWSLWLSPNPCWFPEPSP